MQSEFKKLLGQQNMKKTLVVFHSYFETKYIVTYSHILTVNILEGTTSETPVTELVC